MDGFAQYFASPEQKRDYRLITIWSAPNYSYKSGNKASIMALRLPNEKDHKKLVIFEQCPAYARIEPPEQEKPVATQYFS
jgi:hypothetical protein